MTSILQNAFKFASNLINCTRITGGLLPSRTTPNPPTILQRCRDILWSSERSFIAREMHPNAFLRMHLQGPHRKVRPSKNPLGGAPMLKGVVLKVLIRKPKKPNSANRKCVLVRLSNGKEMTAYIPGEGHNLQEHNIVLVRVGRAQDLPGVKLKCIRGKYDLGHVIKKKQT